MVVVKNVVKHARYGRDVDADPVPEKYVYDSEPDIEDLSDKDGWPLKNVEGKVKLQGVFNELVDLLSQSFDVVQMEVMNDLERVFQYHDHPDLNMDPNKITKGKRGIRYKFTYKKIIRSSICPNGKRPSNYDCTCY